MQLTGRSQCDLVLRCKTGTTVSWAKKLAHCQPNSLFSPCSMVALLKKQRFVMRTEFGHRRTVLTDYLLQLNDCAKRNKTNVFNMKVQFESEMSETVNDANI